jgi:hypothetical protein
MRKPDYGPIPIGRITFILPRERFGRDIGGGGVGIVGHVEVRGVTFRDGCLDSARELGVRSLQDPR